jgi:hypothetical protein
MNNFKHIVYTSSALNQWIQDIATKFNVGVDEISLRETGAHGWSQLDSKEDGTPTLIPDLSGPHWIDASPSNYDHPMKRMGRLFGTFNCVSDTGKIYVNIKRKN